MSRSLIPIYVSLVAKCRGGGSGSNSGDDDTIYHDGAVMRIVIVMNISIMMIMML